MYGATQYNSMYVRTMKIENASSPSDSLFFILPKQVKKKQKYISQPTLTKCDTLRIAWDFIVFEPNHWPYDSRQQHNGMEEQCVFGWMMSKTTKISQNKLKNGFKVCSVAMFCFLSETMQYFKRMVSSKCSVRVLSSTAMQDSLISEQNVLFD